jgi:hypothetical protein
MLRLSSRAIVVTGLSSRLLRLSGQAGLLEGLTPQAKKTETIHITTSDLKKAKKMKMFAKIIRRSILRKLIGA